MMINDGSMGIDSARNFLLLNIIILYFFCVINKSALACESIPSPTKRCLKACQIINSRNNNNNNINRSELE